MKETRSKKIHIVAGIILVSILAFQNVVPVIGSELITDDVVTGGFIKAGVSTLFEEEADIVILNEADILIDESESAIDSFDTSLASLGEELIIDDLTEDIEIETDSLEKKKTSDMSEPKDLLLNDSSDSSTNGVDKGSKDNKDMTTVLKLARAVKNGEKMSDEELAELDVTGDGELGMDDVVKMARCVVEVVE